MRKILYTLLLIGFFSLQNHAVFSQIKLTGPDEYGRLRDITYDLHIENKLYALTLYNHIISSDDNGKTWDILYSDPMGSISALKLLENGSKLSFATYTGATIYNTLNIFDLEKKEISKSIQMPNYYEYSWVNSYCFYDENPDILILDTNYPEGLSIFGKTYYTTDGGQNWDLLYFSEENNTIMINNVAISPDNPEKLFLVRGLGKEDEIGGIWISMDKGKTWDKQLGGYTLSAIAFNPSDANDIFTGTEIAFGAHEEALFRTTDGGSTWEMIDIEWDPCILNNINYITFHPSDHNFIMILEENEVVISEDNGQTWNRTIWNQNYGAAPDYYFGLTASFNPFNPDQVFICPDWYPILSNDRGKTGTLFRTPFFVTDGSMDLYSSETEQHLYYGLQFGYLHEDLSSGSVTPYKVANIDVMSNNGAISFVADKIVPKRIFSLASSFMGGSLEMSNDHGGDNIYLMTTFKNNISALATDPTNTDIVWMALNSYGQLELNKIDLSDLSDIKIIESVLPLEENEPGDAGDFIYGLYIDPDDSANVLAAINARMYLTKDEGQSWEMYGEGLDELDEDNDLILSLSVNPLNNQQIFISTNIGLFTSLDKGKTWAKIYDGLIHKAVHSDKDDGVIAGAVYSTLSSTYTIIYSTDNGETWETIPYDELYMINAYASAFKFNEEKIEVYVPTSDIGVMICTINLSLNSIEKEIIKPAGTDIIIYPNPVEEEINIITDKIIQKTDLYDLNGKKILTSKEAKIDVSKIEKGVYILQVNTEDGTTTNKKIIKR